MYMYLNVFYTVNRLTQIKRASFYNYEKHKKIGT